MAEKKEKVVVKESEGVNLPVYPPLSDEEELSEKSYSILEDEAGTSGGVGAVVESSEEEKGEE